MTAMACTTTAPETLFDHAFSYDLSPVSSDPDRTFTPTGLFDFLPDLSRRIKNEFVLRPEEDLERWDGQS